MSNKRHKEKHKQVQEANCKKITIATDISHSYIWTKFDDIKICHVCWGTLESMSSCCFNT